MKKDYTHICVVLDASGSMGGVINETKSMFNNFIEEQRKVSGEMTIDVFQFATEVNKIVDFKNINDISDLMNNYVCSGWTALRDAICISIDDVGKRLSEIVESERPEKVLFLILTDGFENKSKEFSLQDVKNRINHQTEKYKWDFIYLGANQDAILSGSEYGIDSKRCLNFHNTAGGLDAVGSTINSYATQYRGMSACDANNLNFGKTHAEEKVI